MAKTNNNNGTPIEAWNTESFAAIVCEQWTTNEVKIIRLNDQAKRLLPDAVAAALRESAGAGGDTGRSAMIEYVLLCDELAKAVDFRSLLEPANTAIACDYELTAENAGALVQAFHDDQQFWMEQSRRVSGKC